MKIVKFLILVIFLPINGHAQIKANFFYTKAYTKSKAIFNSKSFLMKNVFQSPSEEVVQFEVNVLATSNSSDITTLSYSSGNKKKEGLVIAFFGDYASESGVLYSGFSFKNLEIEKARQFLNKLKSESESNKKYLKDEYDNKNIYFKYEDIEIIVNQSENGFVYRLIWNGYDSIMDENAFKETFKKFENVKK